MATPQLRSYTLAGTLGEIFVDVRTAGGGSDRPAILCLHGFKGFKDWGFWPPFAERAAHAGFSVVTFNASGSGVDAAGEPTLPGRFARNTYSSELADAATVLAAVRSGVLGLASVGRVGVVGHSRGGGMAVLLAERDPDVAALVTWAAIAEVDRWSAPEKAAWRASGSIPIENARTGQVIQLETDLLDDLERHALELDIEAAASRLDIPWLIVHGVDDDAVNVEAARQLCAAADRDDVEVDLLEGTGHTFGSAHPWQGATSETGQLFSRTIEFFSRHL